MEEREQRQAALPVDLTRQSQNPSMPGEQPGAIASLFQGPDTPWFGIEAVSTPVDAVIGEPDNPRISVVIPARNEAANLPYVLPRLPALVDEVILVDGHSTDGSIAVAQQLLPGIRVIEQPGKGKGDAVRSGLEAATGDIIVMLDADGSAAPEEIAAFVEALLAGSDFAKGSRFLKGGGSQDITRLRRAGNFVLSRLVNLLFGTRFSDLCYGYNAFWRHCLDYVAVDSDGFEVETLINIRMHQAGLKIVEVPSMEHPRIHGVSNLNALRDGWRVLATILKERMGEVPSRVPLPRPLSPLGATEASPVGEEVLL